MSDIQPLQPLQPTTEHDSIEPEHVAQPGPSYGDQYSDSGDTILQYRAYPIISDLDWQQFRKLNIMSVLYTYTIIGTYNYRRILSDPPS